MSAPSPTHVSAAAPTTRAQRRLMPWLLIINAAMLTGFSGFIVIFLPDQIQQIDAANKVGNLAIVSAAASVGAIIVHPLVGALSDRTRSRYGRRTPWLIVGGATAAVFMIAMSLTTELWSVLIVYVLLTVGLNTIGTAQSAVVPDRLPREQFGAASGALAVGAFIGMGLGVGLAGVFANSVGIGYPVFGAVVLGVCVLFTIFNRDEPSLDMAREPYRWKRFFASFWVSPRTFPDFWWAFGGRFLLILAYQSVQSYLLYILRDYVGLSDAESTALSMPLTAAMLVGALLTAYVTGKMSDRLNRRKVFVLISSAIMAASLVIPLVAPSVAGMFAFAGFFGLGYGVYLSVDSALMNEVLPTADAAAKDLGILTIATTLPQALTPLIVWALIALTGSYTSVFLAGIVFALAGALTVLPIRGVR
ncbi:Major Facilitator Superfamily protein [Microbacterium hydrocarbonoxydans]|uniref:Major Facilitator Superfamily protein n=1 Tax=Microbacterium hydrocarbonoxydans TaxID=273678 RepID=A0A0M2HQS0_9MICO|nr:MFS transporter [Microbacterium hydrocarbonoxydans]KJL47265.1 Major Facilitator Superfamily protein [Microbacterium hydrocarbonoxydans]